MRREAVTAAKSFALVPGSHDAQRGSRLATHLFYEFVRESTASRMQLVQVLLGLSIRLSFD